MIEAELDTAMAARRLKRDILEIFGHSSELIVMAPGGLRRGSRFVVRVVAGGDQLARQTGLVDGRGRPIRGLPPQVVSGATCDAEAAWRGAFLAHRLADRARPLLLPGGDLPGSGGRPRPGGRGPPALDRGEGP
ncbi:cell division protein WhiA [Streptomyces tanashiensis]